MGVIAIAAFLSLMAFEGAAAQITATQPNLSSARAVLYDEDSNLPQGRKYVGTARWSIELVSPGPNIPMELAIRVDVELPERPLRMNIVFRRVNHAALPAKFAALPASHTIDIQFPSSANDYPPNVANVPGILMKSDEASRGIPLSGLSVKVSEGFFLIGLSLVPEDVARNEASLKEKSWLDIPLVYANGRRAILAVEKNQIGGAILTNVFQSWTPSNNVQSHRPDSVNGKP